MVSSVKYKPILVTGSIRSGTTWVGKTLALADGVFYIEEPFNNLNTKLYGSHFPHDFYYLHSGNEARYFALMNTLMGQSFTWPEFIRRIGFAETWQDYLPYIKAFGKYQTAFKSNFRPLIKDPMAIASTEWIAKTFHADILMLVRHPAAFIGSLRRLGWGIDFDFFLNQPELMDTWLPNYWQPLLDLKAGNPDRMERGIMAWNICHYLILQFKNKYPNWLIYRHEDISANPVEQFSEIYCRLNLKFTERIRIEIEHQTNSNNPVEAGKGVIHSLSRNSRKGIKNWKEKFSDAEIERIKKGTAEVAAAFYSEHEW